MQTPQVQALSLCETEHLQHQLVLRPCPSPTSGGVLCKETLPQHLLAAKAIQPLSTALQSGADIVLVSNEEQVQQGVAGQPGQARPRVGAIDVPQQHLQALAAVLDLQQYSLLDSMGGASAESAPEQAVMPNTSCSCPVFLTRPTVIRTTAQARRQHMQRPSRLILRCLGAHLRSSMFPSGSECTLMSCEWAGSSAPSSVIRMQSVGHLHLAGR